MSTQVDTNRDHMTLLNAQAATSSLLFFSNIAVEIIFEIPSAFSQASFTIWLQSQSSYTMYTPY